MRNINWQLKQKIIEKCGTQVDFAHLMGLDDTLVSKIIRGTRELDDVGQKLWAGVLDCEVEDIFEEANNA